MKKTIMTLLPLVGTLVVLSCGSESELTADNPPQPEANGNPVSFSLGISQDWTEVEPASRARMAACAPRVIAMEGGDQPAFLVETTVNGIDEIPRRKDATLNYDSEALLCDGAATRGLPVVRVDNLSGFSSYAYHANGSAFYANVRATGSDDLDWGPGHLTTAYVWPSGENLRFYAIHPYDATAAHFDASSASSFKYTFTCNPDVTQQHDLMYASTGSIANSGLSVAPLSFRHALTAVRFCVGQNLSYGATIKSITLHGVKTTGTYTLPTAANADGSWSNLGTPTDITLDGVSLTTDDSPGSIINGEAYTFLLIPQDLSGVTAEIHMNAPQKSTGTLKGYSLTASLSTSSAWHLWFAPESALTPIEVTNHDGDLFNFTTEPLGWVYDDGAITTYSLPRKARVTVRQTVGSDPQTATFIITQNNSVGSGHCTLYQFGRKDAFPGTDSFSGSFSGSFSPAGQGRVSYATAICHPDTFYLYDSSGNNYDWNNSPPKNAWSAEETTYDGNTTVVKTVYAPCPVGYHMPQRNAFRGFTSTGGSTDNPAQFNVSGSFVNGWNFWTNSTHASTIFFPASGYRNYVSGALTRVGSYGCFWSAVPYDTSYGRSLYFGSGSVLPFNANSRAYAFGVRPVKKWGDPSVQLDLSLDLWSLARARIHPFSWICNPAERSDKSD